MTADPADRDPVLMAVADGLETTAEERAAWLAVEDIGAKEGLIYFQERASLCRDIDRLLSERHRAEEAMRERVLAAIVEAKAALHGLGTVAGHMSTALALLAVDVEALPLTPEPTHER